MGRRYSIDQSEFPYEKGRLSELLELGGFSIIRKGVFLAQDIYAEGMKKGDYTIVIDGERYHNACPNRMDAPVTRVNPIEVRSINLVKSSSNLQSGLGGVIVINISLPSDNFKFSSNLSQLIVNSNETDLSFLAEKSRQRISIRYVQGLPYKDGDNRTFKDLYSYKENKKFQFGETSLTGKLSDFMYSGSLMYSENISFPYLQMDEIKSVIYNASLDYSGYKLYVNYTDHLMNNSLRTGNMFMETKAKNLTVGFVSKNVEAYYWWWDGDNNMKMLDGSMPIYNHILPKINLYSANVFSSYKLFGFNLSGKLGLAFYSLGDKSILDFYKKIHPNAKDSRLFPLAGFNLSKSEVINNSISITGMIDLATEAPEAEALFINVKRMMGKPYWSGNPNLYQPFRTSLRVSFGFPYVTMDLYSSYIFNYVYLATKKVGMQNYETFGNVNALLLGTNLQLKYKYLESNLTYTYGQNLSNDQPLIEILPLQISNTLKLPELYGAKIYLKHTYESAQKRIDANFGEKVSSAWNRIDAGVSYYLKNLMASIEVENLLNHTYSKSLSYVRNPFASGMRVIEPGRSIRLSLRYIY